MAGLFSAVRGTARRSVPLVAQCGACGIYKRCLSPKMPVAGEGRRGILVVGEAPGKNEDEQGRPFVGNSGRRLQATLEELDVDLFRDCWVTNALICRPEDNARPTPAEVDYCRPNVLRAIKERQPEVIILLGGVAVRSVIGWLWKEDPGGAEQWAGWRVPNHNPNAWICPTYHPSHILRSEKEGRDTPVPQMFFRRHLEAAINLRGRPWPDGPPRFEDRVEVVLDADKAAGIIREMTRRGGPAAIDYETDRLKPDRKDAEIVSCAICWRGKRTIAYPWHGEAVQATREFWESTATAKIATNAKFEQRWSLSRAGVRPRNWFWDTMLAAHAIDNRAGITGLKFQAFALLGQPPYDEDVKPFLRAEDSNARNRIKELDLPRLLLYNALDALLEYLVAEKQTSQLGVKFPA